MILQFDCLKLVRRRGEKSNAMAEPPIDMFIAASLQADLQPTDNNVSELPHSTSQVRVTMQTTPPARAADPFIEMCASSKPLTPTVCLEYTKHLI